jgi:hypothetical protein
MIFEARQNLRAAIVIWDLWPSIINRRYLFIPQRVSGSKHFFSHSRQSWLSVYPFSERAICPFSSISIQARFYFLPLKITYRSSSLPSINIHSINETYSLFPSSTIYLAISYFEIITFVCYSIPTINPFSSIL